MVRTGFSVLYWFCRVLKPSVHYPRAITHPQRLEDKNEIICFPITDRSFGYQRSNHLLSRFTKNGHRVFYLTVNLYPENKPRSITDITDHIFEDKLNCARNFNICNDIIDKEITESLLLSSKKLHEDFEISASSYITFPSWARLALASASISTSPGVPPSFHI